MLGCPSPSLLHCLLWDRSCQTRNSRSHVQPNLWVLSNTAVTSHMWLVTSKITKMKGNWNEFIRTQLFGHTCPQWRYSQVKWWRGPVSIRGQRDEQNVVDTHSLVFPALKQKKLWHMLQHNELEDVMLNEISQSSTIYNKLFVLYVAYCISYMLLILFLLIYNRYT